jgi:hypothetical protein
VISYFFTYTWIRRSDRRGFDDQFKWFRRQRWHTNNMVVVRALLVCLLYTYVVQWCEVWRERSCSWSMEIASGFYWVFLMEWRSLFLSSSVVMFVHLTNLECSNATMLSSFLVPHVFAWFFPRFFLASLFCGFLPKTSTLVSGGLGNGLWHQIKTLRFEIRNFMFTKRHNSLYPRDGLA